MRNGWRSCGVVMAVLAGSVSLAGGAAWGATEGLVEEKGVVTSVEGRAVHYVGKNEKGEERKNKAEVRAQTRIVVDGKAAKLADIQVGMAVTVTLQTRTAAGLTGKIEARTVAEAQKES